MFSIGNFSWFRCCAYRTKNYRNLFLIFFYTLTNLLYYKSLECPPPLTPLVIKYIVSDPKRPRLRVYISLSEIALHRAFVSLANIIRKPLLRLINNGNIYSASLGGGGWMTEGWAWMTEGWVPWLTNSFTIFVFLPFRQW